LILLFSLVCPNDHEVGGKPLEYAGEGQPPFEWLDNMSQKFLQRIRRSPDPFWKECPHCRTPMRKGLKWGISVNVMKAQTLAEAHAAMIKIATCEIMSTGGRQ
jgi:hypothetical protein